MNFKVNILNFPLPHLLLVLCIMQLFHPVAKFDPSGGRRGGRAWVEGRQEGREEGRQEGREEGRQEGWTERQRFREY